MREVPIVDISEFLKNGPRKYEVAREVGRILEEIGFISIVGHGVPIPTAIDCFQQASRFFSLPSSEKEKIERKPGKARGYHRATNTLSLSNRQAPSDLIEVLAFGPVNKNLQPNSYAGRPDVALHYEANKWPAHPVELKWCVSQCMVAMDSLAKAMWRLFALALRLPENHFEALTDKPMSVLRVNHYPDLPVNFEPEPGQLRIGDHTDLGAFTLLMQDDQGGLEVRNKANEWIPVPYTPGAIIVNTGDLMEMWTNGKWVSTHHRVVLPEDFSIDTTRTSLAYATKPNWDAKITCLETCHDEWNPPKFDPVICVDDQNLKIRKYFG